MVAESAVARKQGGLASAQRAVAAATFDPKRFFGKDGGNGGKTALFPQKGVDIMMWKTLWKLWKNSAAARKTRLRKYGEERGKKKPKGQKKSENAGKEAAGPDFGANT